jgi:cobalamin biosynthetic protein CobC
LRSSDLESNGGTSLFQWVKSEAASELHQTLASSAIFTRFFAEPQSIRFGLPQTEDELERLDKALKHVSLSATM